MKVYIYVKKEEVFLLNGLSSNHTFSEMEDFTIYYSNESLSGYVMVSLTVDQFVYLQDLGFLTMEELLIN